jgi:hypothetical protein
MRYFVSARPRMFGGLIRPGIVFGRSDLRKLASVQFEPDWLDRLAFRMMAIGLVIVAGVAACALGAIVWALFFH